MNVCMYVCGKYQTIESLKITTLGFEVCMYVCSWLRVLGRGNTTECFPGVFSVGDCAAISGEW